MDSATKLALATSAIAIAPVLGGGLARLAGSVYLPTRPKTWLTSLVLLLTLEAGGAVAAVPPPAERMAERPEPTEPPDPDQVPDEANPAGGEIAESPGGSRRYRVRPGDSLWAIACRELSADGTKPTDREIDAHWRAIYRDNRRIVGSDPNLIFPGQNLVLPPIP